MKDIINLIESLLIKNQEKISLNALKEVCKTYCLFDDNEIIEHFKRNNLIKTGLKSNYLPNCLQIEFIKRSRNNDSLAKDLLIKTNYNLVVFLVDQIYKDGSDKEDLIQYGLMGLLHAIDNYDFNKNIPFSSYAVKCINGIIRRFLPIIMNSLKINQDLYYLANKITRIEEQLMKELYKENISDLEILTELQKDNKYKSTKEKHIFYLRNYLLTNLSLDKELTYDDEIGNKYMINNIPSDDNVEKLIMDSLTFELVRKVINKEIESNLSDKEMSVLYYRYGFDDGIKKSLLETGKLLKITTSRVKYIETDALIKLRRLNILKNAK